MEQINHFTKVHEQKIKNIKINKIFGVVKNTIVFQNEDTCMGRIVTKNNDNDVPVKPIYQKIITYSPNGNHALVLQNKRNEVILYDNINKTIEKTFYLKYCKNNFYALNNDASSIVQCRGKDKECEKYVTEWLSTVCCESVCLAKYCTLEKIVKAVFAHHKNMRIAYGNESGDIVICDFDDKHNTFILVKEYKAEHNKKIDALVFTPDDIFILSSHHDEIMIRSATNVDNRSYVFKCNFLLQDIIVGKRISKLFPFVGLLYHKGKDSVIDSYEYKDHYDLFKEKLLLWGLCGTQNDLYFLYR